MKTINYILTPAVKCWHFVFKKKKVQKSVSLNQGNVGRGHPASGNLQQQKAHAAVSCRGSKLHWKRSCCQLKYCLLSHPRTNCVHGKGIRRAESSWETEEGNSGVRATVNWFSLFYQQLSIPENSAARQPASIPAVIQNLVFPSQQARDFSRRRKISARQMKHRLTRWIRKGYWDAGLNG